MLKIYWIERKFGNNPWIVDGEPYYDIDEAKMAYADISASIDWWNSDASIREYCRLILAELPGKTIRVTEGAPIDGQPIEPDIVRPTA